MSYSEIFKEIIVQDLLDRGLKESADLVKVADFGSELRETHKCARTDEGEFGYLVNSKPKLTLITQKRDRSKS